jgi:hypothetical protein
MPDHLLEQIELYNEYVIERLKLIYEFDIWYEQTSGNPFPKEWYDYIQARAESTV